MLKPIRPAWPDMQGMSPENTVDLTAPAARPMIPVLVPVWRRVETASYALARISTGVILAVHGAARLRLINIGGPTIESTARFNASLGIEPGLLWSYYVTGLELGGGILLILGLLTRPAALLLAGFLLVATVYVTPHFGFWTRDGGFEYSLALLALVVCILARGGGTLSLDHWIGREV